MRKISGICAAGLLLASCGSSEEGTIQTDDGDVSYSVDRDGEQVSVDLTGPAGEQVAVRGGQGLTADLPAGFSAYPGAEVVTSTTVSQTDGEGSIVVMTTSDSAEDVITFYKGQAERAGIAIQADMNTNGSRMIAGESAGGLTLSVNATPGGDGKTTAQLVIGSSN